MVFGSHVVPWTKHVQAGRDLIRQAFEVANKMGDLCFAAYSRVNLNTNLLTAGDPLVEVQREAENGLGFAQKTRFGIAIDFITLQLGFIRTLRGLTPKFGCFDDGQFDELRFERHLASNPGLAQPECFYWIRKLQARFLAGDYASALDASLKAEPLLLTAPSNLEMAEYHLYRALCHAASWDSELPDRRLQHFEALKAHHRQLEIWAENCSENYENRAALVGAEIARIEGRALDAERLYEQAIRSAHANGFVHNEALANELAARFYAARGFEKIAYVYLRDARYGYLRWGATGKVRQLDELYPRLQEEKPLAGPMSTIETPVEHLDLSTVIRVSQAVSGEMVLEKLIDTLMRTALEHAGAERGLLILMRGDEQRIEAEAITNGDTVTVRRREAAVSALPESIVHFVARTQECVILADAAAHNLLSADTYIRERHARSVLCLPLINQAKLVGVLYLENNLAPHVFTPTRIAALKLLASQAAISLDWKEAQQALQMTQGELARVSRLTTMGELAASIAHEVNQPLTAVNNNSNACLRLLANQNLQPDVLRRALEEIVADSTRASAVLARIRAFIKKAPAERNELDINEVIQEVLALAGHELDENRVMPEHQMTKALPLVLADRVQLQQVLLNLIMNGIEAMTAVTDRPRLLCVQTRIDESGDVLVAVGDSGTGLGLEADRVFTPFFTTKGNGMGMGLPISRSLIEAHGGRLWAAPNYPHGAVFSFTLPVAAGSPS